jgi:hypothetical protein
VFDNEIDFFSLDTLSENGCDLAKAFIFENFAKILHFSFTDQILATVGPLKTLSANTFNEFGQTFTPLPSHQSTHEIAAIAVLTDGIVYATAQGNVHRVELVSPSGGSDPEFQVKESFSIGGRVTCLSAGRGGEVFIGTEAGMIAKLKPVPASRRFIELYGILAKKVTSLGRLQKGIERLARTGKYYTTRRDIYDTAIVRAFLKMGNDEKEALLANTSFVIEEAMALLSEFESL